MMCKLRSVAATAAALFASVALISGCQSDPPVVDSAHAGDSQAAVGPISLRNVRIMPAFVPGSCALQVGAPSRLEFVAVNTGSTPDRLTQVDTEAADSVSISGTPEQLLLQPDGTLAVGQPMKQPAEPPQPASPVEVLLNQPADWLTPTTFTDVTFTFEHAGNVTFPVHVNPCPLQAPE